MPDTSPIPGLPPRSFDKADPSPDTLFYEQPRLVAHIDDGAIAAVTALYREFLPENGAILDLMGSWISHLPPEVPYASVTGHGMNHAELDANPRLSERFVQDLNANPTLPLEDDSFDAACLCVSVQYLQQPAEVFAELRRVLRDGAPVVVSFSNRCFPTKAVALWQALDGGDRERLVSLYLQHAGFSDIQTREATPRRGDPLWAVIGRA